MSEPEVLESEPTASSDDAAKNSSGAWRLANVLLGVATILGIVSVLTVGARSQVLDTDEWVDLSAEVLDEPAVQESVANFLVDVVYTELDVQAGLADLLPEDLSGLGAPLAGVLRAPLTDAVELLLDSEAFQQAWASANRVAHERMVAILRDDFDGIASTAEGTVTLDLGPLVMQVAENLGLPGNVLNELPEDAGMIVIFESGELDTVQGVVKVLDFLAWFLFALVVAIYALAVYLARGRRMALLRRVGWSVLGVGVIVLAARALAVRSLLDAIVEDPTARPSAENVLDIGTALLRQMGWSAVIYGVLIVLFTSLLGARSWATWVRRALAPALNASPAPVIGGTAVVLLLLVVWQPGRAFEGWITGLTLIGLVIGAIVALRARTQSEFPDVTFSDVVDTLPFVGGPPAPLGPDEHQQSAP
jgi:hypothetical protein